jgi:hypothetical protein
LFTRARWQTIGERSGCVVTTPIGITGALSTSRPERADHLGQRQRGLDQREMRADADSRADAERQVGEAVGRRRGAMKRDGMKAFGSRQSFSCRATATARSDRRRFS